MEIIFLGTGAGIPSTKRNVSSSALRLDSGDIWLFDCGEATQHQILSTSITLSKITRIFITHLHGDHIFGLPGILGSRSFQGGESELVLYGPKGIKPFIECALRVSNTHLRYPLRIEEIEDGMELKEKGLTIETGLLEHGIDSFGYRLEEDDKPGPLNADKLMELGVKPGPIYKKLKDGQSIELENGQIIHPDDVTGPVIRGRCIVVCGDTRYTNKAVNLAKGADILVHEATFSEEKRTLAYDYFHCTTAEAAYVAHKAEVSKLIINHISSRYQDQDINDLLNEARAVFRNTDIAFDQMTFQIPLRKAGSS
ncbi:ribonuclease Z [Pseudalkalibacillus hwajinpoensis]|uniref:Ribonuclease Z n=1 Tax=Guptibacillus hwajinpoensis TaxID=208199 RepID=A0A4U1MFL1_9BACL|nr:ribonuclease Z [Pseudalkalibacillus hwajinpoensis]TKD70029.1 ribonuclease Z [Pseudalkalibacillus hwajinpoensis]